MLPSTRAVYLTRMPSRRTAPGVSVVSASCAPVRKVSLCCVTTAPSRPQPAAHTARQNVTEARRGSMRPLMFFKAKVVSGSLEGGIEELGEAGSHVLQLPGSHSEPPGNQPISMTRSYLINTLKSFSARELCKLA